MKVLLLALFVAAATAAPSAKSSLLSPQLLAAVQSVASDPEFIRLARASDSYKCMVAAGVTPSLNWLLQTGASNVVAHPAVQKCAKEGGGLIAVISNSEAVQYAHAQAIALGMVDEIKQIIQIVFGPEIGGDIIAALQANRPSRLASSKGLLPPHLLAIAHQVASDPEFIRLARASASYKCMVAAGVTPSLPWMLEQGVDALLANPAIKACADQNGGLIHIISTSEAVQYAYGQALAAGVNQEVGQIIVAVFGPVKGPAIVAAIQSNRP